MKHTEALIVSKKNHATAIVDCNPGVAAELNDFFCFLVPGYQFMPSYRNKVWDGKIRLYNSRTGELPIGLLQYLTEFADVREYHILQEPNKWYGLPTTVQEIDPDEIMEDVALSAGGKKIEPRSYQMEAIVHGLNNKRAVLLSPTASGKSLMIYLKTRWFLNKYDKDVLIVVPTTSLVEQMTKDFADYSAYDENFDADDMIHKIYSGKDRFDKSKRIVITTWQSIYKLPKAWYQPFGMVIGDEAHNFKAKSLSAIMTHATEAEYRFGFTGTLDGMETHKLQLEGLFGPVHKVITTKKLMEQDAVAQLDIKVLQMKYPDSARKSMTKHTYQQEMDFIVTHEKRNRFIRNLACAQDGNTLILFNYVEKHGEPLFELIKEKLKDTRRKVFFVSGKVDVKEREDIRAITETEDNAIIVASLGTFSTGINIKNLHNLIFASPSKSQIKVLQSIGRGLRKSDDGRTTQLFDLCDDLCWRKHKNYTFKHAQERISMYTKEHFHYKIVEVDLHE